PGVDHPGELDAGNVAGGAPVAAEVPHGLVGVGELVGEEAAAVALGEDARVAPALAGQRPVVLLGDGADVEDVHDQQVPRLRPLDPERTRERVDGVQRGGGDVLGGVVVLDVAVEPFAAVDAEHVDGVDADDRRDVRMPAVVAEDLLLGEGFRGVEREHVLGHASPSTATGPLHGPARSSTGSGARQPRVARIGGGACPAGPPGGGDPVDDGGFVSARRGALEQPAGGRAEGAEPGRRDAAAGPRTALRAAEVRVARADRHGSLVLMGALAAELVDRHPTLLVTCVTSRDGATIGRGRRARRCFRGNARGRRQTGILGACRSTPPPPPITAPISTATSRSPTPERSRWCTRTSGCSLTTTPGRSGRCIWWWCRSGTSPHSPRPARRTRPTSAHC